MYYEYWKLSKPPFDNVPDPTMYVDCHTSVENAIAETLFAIEEGNECIAVIVGDVGLGKTLSLRMIIDSLEQDKYRIAFVTNPDMSFVQLLKEIVGQLTGRQCEIKKKVDLLEVFNKLLFETLDEGKKVLVFIDEANAMSPANLESLRLLTNMQDDNRNLFTIILAGQIELARRLEHPKRANLFQRIGTYSRIDKLESEPQVKDYVETRLKLAGGNGERIFTDNAVGRIWSYSEYGVPRLINKICKLSLKAGETNSLKQIEGDVIQQIGERFQKLTGPAIQKRKPRNRPAKSLREEPEIAAKDVAEPADMDRMSEPPLREPLTMAPPIEEQEAPAISFECLEMNDPAPEPIRLPDRDFAEVRVNGTVIHLDIPEQVFQEVGSFNDDYRIKLAGLLAAQTMEKHPQLTASHGTDPVAVWHEIRDMVLTILAERKKVV